MLIFSSMVTAVSTLYLSQDNEILLAAPIAPREIYLMRAVTTSVSTSWMVLIFSLPVFGAYGQVFAAGPLFWPLLFFSVPLVAMTASTFALLLTVGIVYLFPARRTKDIVLYLSLCFGLFLYLIFRLMRPEDRSFRPVTAFKGRMVWLFRKELRQFTRDSNEWSQFFMIGALIFVYLYNFKALPLDRSPLPTAYISNLIAFANIGLCGFLAASLATRFVYPAIGGEKGAFYLIASSPLSLPKYVFYKYLFYFAPFTLLSVILITASNALLQISGPMWWISLFAALLITWTVLGLGLGFGAIFADFKAENRAASMGPGAILFLFCAVFYELLVIGLGLLPTYSLVRSAIKGASFAPSDLIYLGLWAGGMVLLSLVVVLYVCRTGIRNLQS